MTSPPFPAHVSANIEKRSWWATSGRTRDRFASRRARARPLSREGSHVSMLGRSRRAPSLGAFIQSVDSARAYITVRLSVSWRIDRDRIRRGRRPGCHPCGRSQTDIRKRSPAPFAPWHRVSPRSIRHFARAELFSRIIVFRRLERRFARAWILVGESAFAMYRCK